MPSYVVDEMSIVWSKSGQLGKITGHNYGAYGLYPCEVGMGS